MTGFWTGWTKKDTPPTIEPSQTIEPTKVNSFLADAERRRPDWSLNSVILLQFTAKYIRDKHPDENLTIDAIEKHVDHVVSDYKRHGNRPNEREANIVKHYMVQRFCEYTQTSIKFSGNGKPNSR